MTDYLPGPYPIPALYKVVGPNGEPVNGGHDDWPLPGADAAGEWRAISGPLEACRNGLHLTSAADIKHWMTSGALVYRAETTGPVYDAGQKFVAARVRLLPGPLAADTLISYIRPFGAASSRWPRNYDVKPRTARDSWLLENGDSLPDGHPMRARFDKLTAGSKRRAARARARYAREQKRAATVCAIWFGADFGALV